MERQDGYEEVKKYPAFRVYDMPNEVAQKLLSRARKYSGNKVWKEIDRMMKICEQMENALSAETILDKLIELDKRISAVEEKINNAVVEIDDGREVIETMGGTLVGDKNAGRKR